MINVTDLKQRSDIDALPYTKEDFKDMLAKSLHKQLVKKEIKPRINTNRTWNQQEEEEKQLDPTTPAPLEVEVASDSQDAERQENENKKCAQQ